MPHPIFVIAGAAVVFGTGYLIYTELTKRSTAEEEWYQNYCAMVREEIKAKKKSDKEKKTESEEGNQDEKDVDSDDSIRNSLRDHIRASSSLRKRIQVKPQTNGSIAPLIDLSDHSYPPSTSRSRSPIQSDPKTTTHLIFEAPPTSDDHSNEPKTSSTESIGQQLVDSTEHASHQDPFQEEPLAATGRPLSPSSAQNQPNCSIQLASNSNDHQSRLPNHPPQPVSSLQTSSTSSSEQDTDETWSDLGSEKFE